MKNAERYRSESQQTVLRLIELLAERPLQGWVLSDIVQRLGSSRDQAYRACQNLALGGWAERTETDAWRLAPRATLLAERVRMALADLHRAYLGDPR